MRITESQLRRIIREEILEGRAEFHDDVRDIKFNLPFGDPLFQGPESKPFKKAARDIKRSWNRNVGKKGDPDRDWIQSLTKVHWIYGHGPYLLQKINRTLTSNRRGEVSAVMYEPGKPIELLKEWGNLGLKIDGWVSLASSSMDTLLSGYIGDVVPGDPKAKIPRYPTHFSRHSPGTYVMGPKDYLFGPHSSGRNEAFVGNWKPVQWVVGPGFYNQINGWDNEPWTQAVLDKIRSTGIPAVTLEGKPIEMNLEKLFEYMTGSTE